MTCKDCIHDEVCYMQEVCEDIEEQLAELGCDDFADKSLYIKLPCKMGDELIIIGERGGCTLDLTGVKMPVVWQKDEEAALEERK